jgi:hypothetical protein
MTHTEQTIVNAIKYIIQNPEQGSGNTDQDILGVLHTYRLAILEEQGS